MMCFRDRGYCDADCANLKCKRKLTDQVKADAEEWWGKPNPPVDTADYSDRCEAYVQHRW
jgi:hypothetical protein